MYLEEEKINSTNLLKDISKLLNLTLIRKLKRNSVYRNKILVRILKMNIELKLQIPQTVFREILWLSWFREIS